MSPSSAYVSTLGYCFWLVNFCPNWLPQLWSWIPQEIVVLVRYRAHSHFFWALRYDRLEFQVMIHVLHTTIRQFSNLSSLSSLSVFCVTWGIFRCATLWMKPLWINSSLPWQHSPSKKSRVWQSIILFHYIRPDRKAQLWSPSFSFRHLSNYSQSWWVFSLASDHSDSQSFF